MVDNFRQFLKFPTVHPDPDYGPAVEFLIEIGNELGLDSKILELFPTKLILILKWPGSDPAAEAILLSSHMDVVPVFPENWIHDPFGAEMDEDGNIYARGTQDMKCVTIQYLEAIRKLITQGFGPRRNVFLSVVPDEEIGGDMGMKALVKTDFFKSMNIGFALDEGVISTDDVFFVSYGERTVSPFSVTFNGNPGHGSLFIGESASEQFASCVSSVYNFRKREHNKLLNDPSLSIGDVATTNLTIINGGVQTNVVPATITACFDLRLPFSLSFDQFCKEVLPENDGKKIIIEKLLDFSPIEPTSLDSPFCQMFFSACDKIGIKTQKLIRPGGSDAEFLREIEIPVLGFSPINNTPVLLHDNEERLNVGVFLRGIDIYCSIIKELSS